MFKLQSAFPKLYQEFSLHRLNASSEERRHNIKYLQVLVSQEKEEPWSKFFFPLQPQEHFWIGACASFEFTRRVLEVVVHMFLWKKKSDFCAVFIHLKQIFSKEVILVQIYSDLQQFHEWSHCVQQFLFLSATLNVSYLIYLFNYFVLMMHPIWIWISRFFNP